MCSSDLEKKKTNEKEVETTTSELDMEKWKGKGLVHSNYWGVYPAHVLCQAGSPWPWNSFIVSQQHLFHFVGNCGKFGISISKRKFQ